MIKITLAVQDPTNFHHLVYDNIEDGVVTHSDDIIGILSLMSRTKRLKNSWMAHSFSNGQFELHRPIESQRQDWKVSG